MAQLCPVEQHLIACIQENLSFYLYDNAKFLAERLVALSASEGNINLLAVCYFRSNQAYRAYHLLKATGLGSHNSRYLYAMCCIQLGKLHDACGVLTKGGDREVPHGAAGLYLLGRVYRQMGSVHDAREQFVRALRLNPLMWCAHEELCALGGDQESQEVLRYAASCHASVLSGKGDFFVEDTNAQDGHHQSQQAYGFQGSGPMTGDQGTRHMAAASTSCQLFGSPNATPAPMASLFGVSNQPPDTASTAPSIQMPPRGGMSSAASGSRDSTGPAFTKGLFSFEAGNTAGGWATPGGASYLTPAGAGSHAGSQGGGLFGSPMPSITAAVGGAAVSTAAFVTPAISAGSIGPPAPPQKQHAGAGNGGSTGQDTFPGFNMGTDTGPGGLRMPGIPSQGPPHPRNARMGDDGRPRKVGGKSLFHDPGSVRRSSRLAALASSGPNSNAPGSAVGPGALVGSTVGGRGGAGGGGVGPGVLQHQSQNLPDPAHPPQAPSQTQVLFDGKVASLNEHGLGVGADTEAAQPAGFGINGVDGGRGLSSVKSNEGQVRAMAMLRFLYEACRHLAMYRAPDALQALEQLPPHQYHTAWVQCAIGRAHFEAMDYNASAEAFKEARKFDHYRVEGMEVYSTVLWHMKRDADLSFLAQEMVAIDRMAPQAWCVLGNFFSAQKEHEAALRLFERALQLDPSFTYAYTLSGHEYAANEDFDKALTCYRNALRFDTRHYNAMYGMGQIYYRQEKYDLALCHFRSAAAVNPRSSVLRCYTGMALAKQGMNDKALARLQEAIDLDPRNPLARYERACVLANMNDVVAALAELEALKKVVPGEASVYFQMGKLYKRLDNLGAAQLALETALSLHTTSADAGAIKAAIEKLGINEDEEEEEL